MSRQPQLEFSTKMEVILDEEVRRRKAAKSITVIQHFLGRDDLTALTVLDVGCSAGFLSDEFAHRGARVVGVDIDVPGLTLAAKRFGERVLFVQADGECLPAPPRSFDIVVLNHIYEHVVDPNALLAEVRRVLGPEGIIYLGLANRLWPLEPHYRLPFLSWLPSRLADRYIRRFARADRYHERLRTRAGLRRLMSGFIIWEYTFSVLREPERFAAHELVPAPLRPVPSAAWRLGTWVLPSYLWIATVEDCSPRGASLHTPPRRLSSR